MTLPTKINMLWVKNPQELERMIFFNDTKKTFAAKVGITPQAIWQMLSLRKSVKPTTAAIIASTLGKTTEELFVMLPPGSRPITPEIPDKW